MGIKETSWPEDDTAVVEATRKMARLTLALPEQGIAICLLINQPIVNSALEIPCSHWAVHIQLVHKLFLSL